jgi:hypothetical protein
MDKSSVSQNRILWLDPNKANNVMVNPEDLCIKVEFSTKRKGRSIIYSGAETINTVDSNANVTFIEGSKVDNSVLPALTTRYTDAIALEVMNTTKQQTDDFESLGIESIDIEFDTANTPLIKIKFIDVRGNAILSQGSMSKYRMFFELPYPIFSLKVKGFYGGTVNYCLHMQRWNASFNSETGNFEIQADFMGFTYALLTDLLIGLIRAAVRTKRGQDKLILKQGEYGENSNLIITIDEMLTKFVELNNTTQKISQEDNSAAQLQGHDEIVADLESIRVAFDTFSASIYDGANPVNTYFKSPDGVVLCVPNGADSDKKYETALKAYEETITGLVNAVNNKISDDTLKLNENLLKDVVKISDITKAQLTSADNINEIINHSGGKYTSDETNKDYVKELLKVIGNLGTSVATDDTKLNIYNLKRIQYHFNDIKTKLAENKTKTETDFNAKLADTAESIIGFEPTIRNIFRVLSVNAEIFLEVLKDVSVEAQSDTSGKRAVEFNKISGLLNVNQADVVNVEKKTIYPWPEYRQEKAGEGYVETWLGKAPVIATNINEVVFVKELHTELLNVAKFDKDLQEQIDNPDAGADVDTNAIAPADAWFPLTPADTPINPLMTQNPYIEATDANNADEVKRLVLLRTFMLLGVSTFNSKIKSSKGGALLKIMGTLEAETLVAACRKLGKNGQALLATMLEEVKDEDEEKRITAFINKITEFGAEGSSKITNPGGVSKKPILIKTTVSVDNGVQTIPGDQLKSHYYKYVYIRDDDAKAAYIPVNTGFDGSGFYNSDNTFKSKSDLKELSSSIMFVSNPKNYEGTANTNTFKDIDDGSLHVKLYELSEYTASSMIPEFGKEITDGYISSLDEANSVPRVDSVYRSIVNNEVTKSNDSDEIIDGLNPYNGNYSVLEMNSLNYEKTIEMNEFNYYMGEPMWKGDTKVDSSLIGFYTEFNNFEFNGDRNNVEYPVVGTYLSYPIDKKLYDDSILYAGDGEYSDNIYFMPELERTIINTNSKIFRKTWADNGAYLKQKGLLSLGIKGNKLYLPFIEFGISNADVRTSGSNNTGNLSVSLFGSYFYYRQPLDEVRALLFLHTIPWQGVKNFGADIQEMMMLDKYLDWTSWQHLKEEETKGNYTRVSSIRTLFQVNGAFVHAPKAWVLFIGAMLWRVRYTATHNNTDPIVYSGREGKKYTLIPANVRTPLSIEYLYLSSPYGDDYAEHNPWGMFFGDNPNGYAVTRDLSYKITGAALAYETYVPLDLTLMNLPKQVRDEFISYFEEWVKDDTGFKFIQKELELYTSKSNYDDWFTKNQKVRNLAKAPNSNQTGLQKHISRTELNKLFTESVVNNYALISGVKDFVNDGASTVGNLNTIFKPNTPVMNYMVSLLTQPTVIQNVNPNIWNYDYYDKGARYVGGDKFKKQASEAGYQNGTSSKSIRVRADKFRIYLSGFYSRLITLNEAYQKEVIPDPEDELEQEIFGTGDDDTINLMIYRILSSINDKWLNGSENKSAFSQCGETTKNEIDLKHAKKFRTSATEASLIDTFRFVDRAFSDIGDKFYLNINSVTDLIRANYNQSYFDIINKILSDNNFNFIPLPTFVNFNNIDELKTVFTAYTYNNPVTFKGTGPAFVCVYVGQASTNLDLGTDSVYPDDGLSISMNSDTGTIELPVEASDLNSPIEADSLDGNVPVFAVNYGQQNQNYFRSIKLDQREFTETMESLQVIESISQTGDKSKPTYAGNNLFNVYQTRSYSAEVEMLGSAMIQPMMYFQLNNIPMFRGAYLIYKVTHSIKPHSMTTTFKGNRVKKAKTPLMDKATMLMNLIGTTGAGGQIGSDRGVSAGYYSAIIATLIENGVTNGFMEAGQPIGQITNKPVDLNGTGFVNLAGPNFMITEAADALRKMLYALTNWMDNNGFSQFKNKPYGQCTSMYRTYATQVKISGGKNTAAAGTSFHGWGIAVDWTWIGKDGKLFKRNYSGEGGSPKSDFDFTNDPVLEWLFNNSYRFGFLNPGWAHDVGSYDEVWHWEYHGTQAPCIVAKSKTIFGQAYDTTKALDSIVKNPKTPDGKEAVYPATSCDTKYVKARDGGDSGILKSTIITDATKAQNQVTVKDYFKAKGLSKEAVAGIMGNIQRESTFNPGALNPKDSNGLPSRGLIQWNENTAKPSDFGSTVESQLDYLIVFGGRYKRYLKELIELRDSGRPADASEAAYWFAKYVEVCGGCTGTYENFLKKNNNQTQLRSEYANDFFKRFNTAGDSLKW